MIYTHYKFLKFLLITISCLCVVTSGSTLKTFAAVDIVPYNSNNRLPTETNWFVLNAQPGQTLNESVRLNNSSKTATNVELNTQDSQILEDGSFAVLNNQQKNELSGKWFKFDVSKVTLESNTFARIPFQIDIPKETKDGEYAAGITATEVNPDQSAIQVLLRKGLRVYVAVGGDFKLNSEVNNLNIVDPKDANFDEIKNSKPYFGSDNMLLSFEAENKGNIFGVLEVKYSLKFSDGSVFENNFTTELAPNVGKRTYYIVTNQAYKTGLTEAFLDYKIKPQNIDSNKVKNEKVTGILNDNLTLTQSELDNFAPAKTKFFVQGIKSSDQNNESDKKPWYKDLKTILPVIIVALLLLSALIYYILKKNMHKKFIDKIKTKKNIITPENLDTTDYS